MSNDMDMRLLDDASDEVFSDPLFIRRIREDMLKFARLQLRDEGMAEDAVQEALLAAHRNIEKFGRKSAFLVSSLKCNDQR
ncbi:sigma factor [Vibrio cholerae]